MLRIKILYLSVARMAGRYIDSSFRTPVGPESCTLICRYTKPSFRTVGLTSCTLDNRCIEFGSRGLSLMTATLNPPSNWRDWRGLPSMTAASGPPSGERRQPRATANVPSRGPANKTSD